ncbi:hypothetical protein DM02DRAFT_724667 [Periconia macrospinosa]|uniref:Uncharacterized protein n=1 Tax=Periconia macrospinosa TaxID=97972 RepID=A0A2V1E5M4_9PLEO|nr:hypothetical protein DM02DRAFT_724667 [Periconia macrospinosa]
MYTLVDQGKEGTCFSTQLFASKMPLRKRVKAPSVGDTTAAEGKTNTHAHAHANGNGKGKKSKRQRLADFFRQRKHTKQTTPAGKQDHLTPEPIPVPVKKEQRQEPPRDSKIADSSRPAKSDGPATVRPSSSNKVDETSLPTPPPGPQQESPDEQQEEPKTEPKAEPLSEEYIHTLFAGAPHFSLQRANGRSIPTASYPWDEDLLIRDVSDSVQLAHPAFSASTLHRHLPILRQATDQDKLYQGYDIDVLEVPTMLSSQGLECGTIGFAHFLELPYADNLVTDLQQSQTSNEYLEAMRNKEMMQTKPERLGIRSVDKSLVHDRLIEFGDLFELFHDSPERMTILNNQSSGDLYANLFGRFLTPPGYDGSTDDPTGIKVQIDTLLKILALKGVWYDFSLVEWRIRLGQILWSDAYSEFDQDSQQLWTDREKLLLQITLACELLLRLDAVTSLDVDDIKAQIHVSPEDFQGFLKLKTKKTDWDLVLARRFLENILVVKESDREAPTPLDNPRGFMSMLSTGSAKQTEVKDDIVLLPQHQARQLSGLLQFAQTIQWPSMDLVLTDLAQKLRIPEPSEEHDQATSPYGRFVDPSTPSSVSVYGTPLASPRSNEMLDSYFGNLIRPTLNRANSQSLQVPLSSTLVAQADGPENALNVGGWLSRSFLTGLVLPGEAISHFLISTLLENDKLAIAALGDSANLYGGFVYSGRTWWSKASIVARVFGCIGNAVECMGWVCFPKVPEDLPDGWYAINSERAVFEQPARISGEEDRVMQDSLLVPDGTDASVHPTDLTLPVDAASPPIPSIELLKWNLTLINMDFSDNDTFSKPSTEGETYIASITVSTVGRMSTFSLSLTHDVHFITSWPCTTPASSPTPSTPHIFKRSQTLPLSRSSSRHSNPGGRAGSNQTSRHLSRRNSHGFEPLLSHPPDSPGILPTRMYSPTLDGDELNSTVTPRREPMDAHPLHASYKFKLIPATDVLDANFSLPFTKQTNTVSTPSVLNSPNEDKPDGILVDHSKTVLVLDARSSKDLELLARAWCAEKGHHAIVGRVGRTCLACCIREARGIGVNVVIRV